MSQRPAPQQETTIPVIEEQPGTTRRMVETGGKLRLRKRMEEVPGEVTEPLVSEFVDVERVPVGRVLDEPVGIRHEGDVTIVPVVEERLVLRKELVLVEEIRLTRRREEHELREQVTLRRERVAIERFDPATQQWLLEDEG